MNIKYDIEPTVLYKKVNNQLSQLATVKFEGIKFPKDINFKLNLFTDGWKKEFKIDSKNRNNNYDFKNTYFEIYIPVVKEESKCRAVLEINDDKFEKDVVLKPRRMWEVHIQNFTHTDIGFTDLPSRVAEGYKDSIKSILNFYNETKDFDEDSIYKWNVETGYWLENALSGLSSNQLIQFKNMIKNSHAEITPLYVAHTSELNDEETLIRSLYFAFEFAKECGVRIETAMASDITGQPWILPQVFSKSGIKYFSTAVNATMAKALKLDRPFYWQSRDGSKILLLDTDERQAYQEGVMIGLHQDYNTVLKKLPAYLKDLEETDNFKFDLIALRAPGYPGDNTKPNVAVSYIVKEWNKIWEYPKLKISTYGSYFRKFEKIYGKSLKTYCGAWPDWWVSYHGAVAFEIGVNRNTHSDIITGERLSSILKTYNGKSFYYPESELKEVYKKMFLADEVDWSSYTSISEPDCLQSKGQRYENASFVYQAAINAEEIAENSKSCLAKMGKSNTKSSIVVSNCLDFERSDIAEVALPRKLFKDKKGFKIFDSISGSEVKSQFMEPDIHDMQTGNARIAFAAENIPPLGFKVFDFTVYDTDKGCEDIGDTQSGKIENCFYKVIYDNKTGQIEKIIDKDLNMDLIDTKSGFKFNQFIYESDTNKRFIDLSQHEGLSEDVLFLQPFYRKLHEDFYDSPTKQVKFKKYFAQNSRTLDIKKGPIYTEILTSSSSFMFPEIKSHIILDNCFKKIIVKNFLSKYENLNMESLYFMFPFNVSNPCFRLNCHGGYYEPEKEQLPGSSKDWYCIQKWIDVSNEDFGITWSPFEAPLVQLGGINTGKYLDKIELKNAVISSFVMNNHWWTNSPASQGGRFNFTYFIESYKPPFNSSNAQHFGWSQHLPLNANFVNESLNGKFKQYRFIDNLPENILLIGFKMPEDKNGLLLRLLEISGKECSFEFSVSNKKIEQSYLATPLEENIKTLKVRGGKVDMVIKPFELVTFKIEF